MERSQRRYRGFISYSQKDKAYARRLQRALETFRVPRGVKAEGLDAKARRLGRFFRDDDEMGAASDLGDALRGAIADSESIVVICSPNSAKSVWVNQEIAHFKRTGRADKVFAVIVAGEANVSAPTDDVRRAKECFPPALRFEVEADGTVSNRPDEPLGIDIRKEAPKRVSARLAAGLLDVPFDDLWGRAKRRAQQQALAVAAMAALAVAAGVGVLLWVNGTVSSTQKVADAAQIARIAERAELALTTAEGLSDKRGVNFDQETPEQRAAQSDARWKAATLTYATSLIGGDERAQRLYARLGYAQSATYLAEAFLTPGDLVPSAGWNYIVSIDPPFTQQADGKFERTGQLFPSTGASPINFRGEMLDSVAISASRRWMALASNDVEEEPPLSEEEGKKELTEDELDSFLSDLSSTVRVDIWDLDAGKIVWAAKTKITDFQKPVPAISNDDEVLALVRTGGLQLFDMATHKLIIDVPMPKQPAKVDEEWVKLASFSRDGTRVYMMVQNLTLLTYDIPSKAWLKPVKAEEGTGSSLSNLPTAKHINAGTDKARVLLEKSIANAAGHTVTSAYILNVGTGTVELRLEPQCPAGGKYCTIELHEFSEDGRTAKTRDDHVGTFLTDLTGARPPLKLLLDSCLDAPDAGTNTPCATTAALAPRDAMVAVGEIDGSVRLIDAVTGNEIRALTKAAGNIGYLAFTPEGDRLIGFASTPSGMQDGLIVVWDVASGAMISRSGLANTINGEIMAVENGGRRFVATETQGATMWQSLGPVNETPAQALNRLCAVRGDAGLKIAEDDRSALPASAPKDADLCKWPAVVSAARK